jgi:hypothetical protein
MDVVVRARKTTGQIEGVYRSSDATVLEAQATIVEATHDYLLVETEASDQVLQSRYYIQGGALTPKTEVTITANPMQFVGDGVATSNITVTPFAPCTLLVNGTPTALTAEDQVLELSSTVPQLFLITLNAQADLWGDAITVEAT